MVTEGNIQVLGGGSTLLTYIVNAHLQVKSKLYSEEKAAQIDGMVNWYVTKMRPTTHRYMKMIIPSKIFGEAPKDPKEKADLKEEIFG